MKDLDKKIARELVSMGFEMIEDLQWDKDDPSKEFIHVTDPEEIIETADFCMLFNDTLRVRIISDLVEIACKEAFDRWANSIDFVVKLDGYYDSKHNWSIARAIEIATKICESGIVNFDKMELRGELDLSLVNVEA